MHADGLDANSVWDDLTLLLESVVIRLNELGETELSGDEDFLSSWELELSSSEGFFGVWNILVLNSNREKNLSNGDSCGLAESLTEGTSHTLLKSIGSSAGEHLVDSNDVPWVDSDSAVETFSSDLGHHVLVTGNSRSLKSLRGDLLLLVANQMDAGWERIKLGLLLTNIVNSEFWVWYTSVESGFWIWLVLLISVAP